MDVRVVCTELAGSVDIVHGLGLFATIFQKTGSACFFRYEDSYTAGF
jgi:hypothetical protein